MTLEEKIDYVGSMDLMYVRALPRLGLPAFKMSDGPLGVRGTGDCHGVSRGNHGSGELEPGTRIPRWAAWWRTTRKRAA